MSNDTISLAQSINFLPRICRIIPKLTAKSKMNNNNDDPVYVYETSKKKYLNEKPLLI